MKNLLCIFLLFFSLFGYSQPNDATIKKDLTNSKTISITFTKTTGTRQWNSSIGNYEYVRGVIITSKSGPYPDYNVVARGDAVYQYMGGSSYKYWKFREIDAHYLGIPNPTEEEIIGLISEDWKKFYGYDYRNIIQLIDNPKIKGDDSFKWHTPNSFSVEMVFVAEIINGFSVETKEMNQSLRFYKDDVNAEWTNFIVSKGIQKVLEKKDYHAEEIKDLKLKTLEHVHGEQEAQAKVESLPEVKLPEFKEFIEIVDYLHLILLSGDENKLEAVLIQLLSRRKYFEPGSDIQLNYFGEELIKKIKADAFGHKYKYADQICRNYTFGDLSSEKHVSINGAVPYSGALIKGALVPAGYKNGVQIWKWELTDLQVYVLQTQAAADFINSFDNSSKLCPDD